MFPDNIEEEILGNGITETEMGEVWIISSSLPSLKSSRVSLSLTGVVRGVAISGFENLRQKCKNFLKILIF